LSVTPTLDPLEILFLLKAFPRLAIHLDLGREDGLEAVQARDRHTGRLLGQATGNSVQREAFVIAKVVRALYGGLLEDKESRWISTKPCIYISSLPGLPYHFVFLFIYFYLLYRLHFCT
jgi:hypothetical protein